MDRCIYIYIYMYLVTYTGFRVSALGHRDSGVKENQVEKNTES